MTKSCIKSACPYCGVGCGVSIQGDKIVGDVSHPANRGALCVKGSALAESLNIPSRLLYPKIDGQQVSWDSVTSHISDKLAKTIALYGPDSVAFYLSGQILTEDYYVANKLMKGYVGSANVDTNSRLCMSSAVVAHTRAFGEDLVPVDYDDLSKADLIVITGANTAWTHPIVFRRIQQAREENPNLKLVVIDPRKTVTAEQADLHIPINSDDDVFLYNALMNYCITTNQIDSTFIESHVNHWSELKAEITLPKYQLNAASDYLSIEKSLLRAFFQWFAASPKAISLFCQGYNQAANGADKGNALINAHLITGKIGKTGCGPFSITGQPNAMGGREVGGLANQLAVHRGFDDESIQLVEQYWQAPNMATKPGLKAVDMFDAMLEGKIKFVWIMSTNPVVSMPDSNKVRRALEKCEHVIVSDITMETDTAQYANVLLPAAGWGEKEGMVTNSERRMTRQRKFTAAPGEAKADWLALSLVGSKFCQKIGVQDGFQFTQAADVFREYAGLTGINKHSPLALEISPLSSLTDQEYRDWLPTQWPLSNKPLDNFSFSTSDGKANLIVTKTPDSKPAEGWWLNTGRQRDQWHTMTRTGYIAHLTESEIEPTVYMSSLSAEHAGLKEGHLVKIHAIDNENHVLAKLKIDNGLSYKQLFMSMHWAGVYGGKSQVNKVVSASTDPLSGQPAFKSSFVELAPANVGSYGVYLGNSLTDPQWDYVSYQQKDGTGVWRFANEKPINKSLLGKSPSSKQIILDQNQGWVALECSQDPLDKQSQQVDGIMIISRTPILYSIDKLAECINQPLKLGALLNVLASADGVADKLVCSCYRVSEQQILTAIEEDGCHSLHLLQEKLKCGTNCGSCLPEVGQYLSASAPAQKIQITEPSENTRLNPSTSDK